MQREKLVIRAADSSKKRPGFMVVDCLGTVTRVTNEQRLENQLGNNLITLVGELGESELGKLREVVFRDTGKTYTTLKEVFA